MGELPPKSQHGRTQLGKQVAEFHSGGMSDIIAHCVKGNSALKIMSPQLDLKCWFILAFDMNAIRCYLKHGWRLNFTPEISCCKALPFCAFDHACGDT